MATITRIPDVSFIRAERLTGGPPRRGGWPFAPDLAVGVLSPSERRSAVHKKLADYFGARARAVWLIGVDDRGVEVHTPGAPAVWVDETGVLDGGEVLPGFTLPVADVYAGVPIERASEPES